MRQDSLPLLARVGETYNYDAAGRLTNVTKNGNQAEAYQYDENGNRTLTTYGSGEAEESIAATFDARDRMTTYGNLALSYNADGELTEKRNTQTGDATSFTYSASGALTGAVTAGGDHLTYTYDALGNLVSRSKNGNTTGGFLYAPGITGPVAELGEDGDAEAAFIYATRSNVPDYMVQASRTYRLITDQIGSVWLVVDAETGSIEQEIEYDAFGRVTSDSAPGFQPFYFAGGLYDSATKLTHFGAREYDAELGRWTSADPISFAGGDSNLYGYVVGDPVNFLDPSGTVRLVPSLEQVSNFSAGFGDSVTLGATNLVRSWLGTNGAVDKCGLAYRAVALPDR